MRNAPTHDECQALPFLARELATLAPRIGLLEMRVGEMALGGGADTEMVVALQDLDVIRQTIEDLASLAEAASGTADAPDSRKEALARYLKLGRLRDRFLNGTGTNVPDSVEHEPFEKFGAPAG